MPLIHPLLFAGPRDRSAHVAWNANRHSKNLPGWHNSTNPSLCLLVKSANTIFELYMPVSKKSRIVLYKQKFGHQIDINVYKELNFHVTPNLGHCPTYRLVKTLQEVSVKRNDTASSFQLKSGHAWKYLRIQLYSKKKLFHWIIPNIPPGHIPSNGCCKFSDWNGLHTFGCVTTAMNQNSALTIAWE